jgi:hypothetical protein
MMTFLEWQEKTQLYGTLHYDAYKTIWDAAQQYEREECAKLIEQSETQDGFSQIYLADRIRARK